MTRSLRIMTIVMLGFAVAPAMAVDPPDFVKDAASQEIDPPPADKAQIILLEPVNRIQGYFPVTIWSLQGDERTILTMTIYESKAELLLPPGQHRLMSNSLLTKVHFMDVDVEAGKRYYVLVRFLYNEGFQLRPIRPTATSDFNMVGADWKEWLSKTTRVVERSPAGDEWLQKEKVIKRLDKLYAKAVVAWNKKTDAEKAELRLTPADAAPL